MSEYTTDQERQLAIDKLHDLVEALNQIVDKDNDADAKNLVTLCGMWALSLRNDAARSILTSHITEMLTEMEYLRGENVLS